MKHNLCRLLIVIALALGANQTILAGEDIILIEDHKLNEGKERPRMPARPIIGQYGEGVFSVPEWPWLDETAHLTIVPTDGAVAADLDCSGTDLAAGIYVGSFDTFTVTFATASGGTLSGACLPGQ